MKELDIRTFLEDAAKDDSLVDELLENYEETVIELIEKYLKALRSQESK